MLREILEKHKHDLFPTPYFGKIPDQFSPTFMKALQQDAEMDGMVDQANAMIVEKIQQNEDYNEHLLDETWEAGVKKGHEIGVGHGKTSGKNEGLLEGLLRGWHDAATFKKPNRVYNLAKPTIVPIAEGNGGKELADAIPDDTENRLWRSSTDKMANQRQGYPLKRWKQIENMPFVYHPENNRLGINLTEFMKPVDPIEGVEAKIPETGNGQASITNVIRKRRTVVKNALGVKNKPAQLGEIPPRPNRKVKEPQVTEELPIVPVPKKTPKKTPKKMSSRDRRHAEKLVDEGVSPEAAGLPGAPIKGKREKEPLQVPPVFQLPIDKPKKEPKEKDEDEEGTGLTMKELYDVLGIEEGK